MKPIVKISESVIKRLSVATCCCSGKLYGVFCKNTLIVLGLQADTECGFDLVNSYPAEVDICGIFEISDEDCCLKPQQIHDSIKDIDVTDNPVFISCHLKCRNKNDIKINVVTNEKMELQVNYDIIKESDVIPQYVFVRLTGKLNMSCEANSKSIDDSFANIRKIVTSGAIGFTFPCNNACLLGSEYENSLFGSSMKDSSLDDFFDKNGLNEGVERKKKTERSELEVVNVNMLKRVTKEGELNGKEHAPICILNKKPTEALSMPIAIDSLSMIHRQTKVVKLYEILVESIVRYLKLYELEFLNVIKDDLLEIAKPETFHFYPRGCGHFLTRIYLKNKSETDLLPQRRLLHKTLLLDEIVPLFRRENSFKFKNILSKCSTLLINPHVGVKTTDNGGKICLVRGEYEYYHYCQDKMDDNGWGCAYRSLQTLASWFKLQGYTNRSVPNFQEIQKCLVDIGDKPSNFVGSREWIGSTEVSFVLNTLLGIESKILFVSSGEEMSTVGPSLVHHFENYGSPIMIGGGVLAHTILGVDYNQETGNIMFLILDPHYTGNEDLHTIQSKGWCGWKNVNFWNKTAHYNMCLPLVPKEI